MILATLALAQEVPAINAQLFHSSVDGRVGFSLDDAHVAPDRMVTARAALQYVNQPLVYLPAAGAPVEIVSDLFALDVLASYTFRRLRVGLDVPLYLVTAGRDLSGGGRLGDIGLDLKYVALDPASRPVGLAATGRILVPAGGAAAAVGSGGFGMELGLAGSRAFGPWTVAANLGHRGVPEVELENIAWGSHLTFRAGVSRAVNDGAGVSLELGGASVYSSFLSDPSSSPVEGMLGGWYRVGEGAVARLGVGTGLTPGIGSPVARVIGSVAFEPREIRDADRDGIVDRQDACRDVPEDVDAFEDTDGCPEPDNDHDGVADVEDGCPNAPEDHDRWQDEDGCPDMLTAIDLEVVDAAGGPIPGVRVGFGDARGASGMHLESAAGVFAFSAVAPDWVPLAESIVVANGPPLKVTRIMKPETTGVTLLAEVLPPARVVLPPARVVITREKLEILDRVFFDTNRSTIKTISHPLLDEVTRILLDHPEIQKLRIEGHTDSRGKEAANLTLSSGRAAAVMAYLVKGGVAADRLSAIGLGESRPVDTLETEAAWEKNRRVEFVIERREEPSPAK